MRLLVWLWVSFFSFHFVCLPCWMRMSFVVHIEIVWTKSDRVYLWCIVRHKQIPSYFLFCDDLNEVYHPMLLYVCDCKPFANWFCCIILLLDTNYDGFFLKPIRYSTTLKRAAAQPFRYYSSRFTFARKISPRKKSPFPHTFRIQETLLI